LLDLRLLRSEPDLARAALARRGIDGAVLDELLALDSRRRELLPELEGIRKAKNEASKRIGELQRKGEDASEAIAEVKSVGEREKALESEIGQAEQRRDGLLASLPNLPDKTAPHEDEVLREVGESGAAGKDHLVLLDGLVDLEAGARVAGSRFAYLKGPLVRLEFALVQWALDLLEAKGFTPVVPPVLVREEALFGTGFLPDTEQQIYSVPDDDLYLAGTSEVPLASLHAGELLAEEELPRRYAGFSTCFRREAGAAGKDTRGIFRVHQFDKVEMFAFVAPEESGTEHERLLAIEEEILQALEIPYRVVNIAVGDLGNSAAKKYDLEAWLPGQERYRELTSCSNTTDYQARRLEARYRPAAGKGPRHLHTLNGTAVAIGRTIIALAENRQREDGSVEPGSGPTSHAALNQRSPAEQKPHRAERLPGPAVEAELVTVLGDQPVPESEGRPNVVVDVATGLRERVVGEPVRGAGIVRRLVLEQLDVQVVGAARQHPPHRTGLLAAQVLEDRVGEARVRRVAGRHRIALVPIERRVEALDQLGVGMGHGADPIPFTQ
jgi:seryl-tRNA synthetase